MPGYVVTGATGFVGDLIVQTLLRDETNRLLLPIRAHHDVEDFRSYLESELGKAAERVDVVSIQRYDEAFVSQLERWKPDVIVHAAASVSYFDQETLHDSNIELTRTWLAITHKLAVCRFVYISTAFSAGYTDQIIPENLPPEHGSDPTNYTQTKRQAERMVAEAGGNYLVLRPSVVIGHSMTGEYTGKPYGLYQFLKIAERFMNPKKPVAEVHLVAPSRACHFLHQDAFQLAFQACMQQNITGFVNLVSRQQTLPTCREIVHDWLSRFFPDERIYLYETRNAVDETVLASDTRLEMFLEAVAVNLDIASHPFTFETATLDGLRERGWQIPDVTQASVNRCFDRFIADSSRLHCWPKPENAQINQA